jgi:hypothetical protein
LYMSVEALRPWGIHVVLPLSSTLERYWWSDDKS